MPKYFLILPLHYRVKGEAQSPLGGRAPLEEAEKEEEKEAQRWREGEGET